MARETTTLRFLTGLLTPGGVLLAAAWALQSEAVVRAAAAPYAVYFAFGALAAAILLCWYHDQSRLLAVASAVALTVIALERWPGDANIVKLAAIFLLPLNFVLFAALRENGVMTIQGLGKLVIVIGQAAGVAWMSGEMSQEVEPFLRWREPVGGWSTMPLVAQLSFAIAALTLLTLVFRRRTKVEQGLLWALAAMFLGVYGILTPPALLFYAGAAGLVLVLTVLEHGDDIAYRDELTGLLGRRAFNSMMGQLGRTYAIAMCDVDQFKKFNDTYGHDAGDQVLRMVSAKLSQVGGGGRVFRYGGEEFLVVFRGRSAAEAAPFAESVRKAIADAGFVLRGPDRPARRPLRRSEASHKSHSRAGLTISVSIGLAERSQRHSTPELVLEAADAALYRAKEEGRNRVRLAESTQYV
ncbi:MAG TPA: GGDEF domain-containing protein [Vicinamibacterales bacterium]|nr:GGDEF domain-containing protein [Vicinamibacterales bacterium]